MLVAPTAKEKMTKQILKAYKDSSNILAELIVKYQLGYKGEAVTFAKVKHADFNGDEQKIYGRYTDAICREAEDSYKRYLEMAKYFALFLTFLILMILALICCGCLTCVQYKRRTRKNNFFGHNNGEDNLKIEHHWQQVEESEE